jgi:hypothetical protein
VSTIWGDIIRRERSTVMTVGKRGDQNISGAIVRALELTEEALAEVTQIAIEEIRDGLEASNHVDAAERDMRSALRQLVLAEREVRARSGSRLASDQRQEPVAEIVPGPGSGATRRP